MAPLLAPLLLFHADDMMMIMIRSKFYKALVAKKRVDFPTSTILHKHNPSHFIVNIRVVIQ